MVNSLHNSFYLIEGIKECLPTGEQVLRMLANRVNRDFNDFILDAMIEKQGQVMVIKEQLND